jgi:hypothetical protein
LVLRNGSDQTIEKPPGREVGELYGLHASRKKPAEAPPVRPRPRMVNVVAAPPPPAPPPPDQIIIIRGTQKSVEIVGATRPDGGK